MEGLTVESMTSEDSGSVQEQGRDPRRECPGIWKVYAAGAAKSEQTVRATSQRADEDTLE